MLRDATWQSQLSSVSAYAHSLSSYPTLAARCCTSITSRPFPLAEIPSGLPRGGANGITRCWSPWFGESSGHRRAVLTRTPIPGRRKRASGDWLGLTKTPRQLAHYLVGWSR